ncbi:hypothetical protein M8C13_40385 [Crossiella sp. SN42]|uniref:hypothetical protein n=1 Tax=Crossiella sp. SN42 TaxID=2944808 RepID=UPI00207C90D4|nr:hypothetical protein [Crossiella sp. SN42]MCO1582026.1 hypothetical protein [Crossiella sp. SN42]
MTALNHNAACSGYSAGSLERCAFRSAFWVRHAADTDWGTHACAAHLAQIVRWVASGHDNCDPIVRVLAGAR